MAAHFTPWNADRQPCWHCTHYCGLTADGAAARCSLPNAARIRSMPAGGCSAWKREPGTDDEPDAVPQLVVVADQGARVWKAKEAPPVKVAVAWAP